MASKLKLQNDIKKLEAAIKSKKTPPKLLPALKKQLEKAKDELAAATKAKRKPKASVVQQTSQTIKDLLAKKEYSVYKGAKVDLQRDAGRPALKTGKRISKNGNTYYEYRANRVDVNPRRYPKLEKGGALSQLKKGKELVDGYKELDKKKNKYAQGGMINHGLQMGDRIIQVYKGYGIVQDSSDSFVVVNPEKGERHPVMESGDYDAMVFAAKKMIDESAPISLTLMDEHSMKQFAKGGQIHKVEGKYAMGAFKESEFKKILEEAVDHLYRGLNKVELAMNYLHVKGQGGMTSAFMQKFHVKNLKESVEAIDEYTEKK